jgi:hypothetical protein
MRRRRAASRRRREIISLAPYPNANPISRGMVKTPTSESVMIILSTKKKGAYLFS